MLFSIRGREILGTCRLRGQGLELEAKAKDFKMCPRGQGRL